MRTRYPLSGGPQAACRARTTFEKPRGRRVKGPWCPEGAVVLHLQGERMADEHDQEPRPLTSYELNLFRRVFAAYQLTAVRRTAQRDDGLTLLSSWEEREQLARTTGLWLRRRLDGGAAAVQGEPCPRCRLDGRSRVWVCVVDDAGRQLRPVAVSLTATGLLAAGAHGSRPGALAVVTAWPSQREARECVVAAGLEWPTELLR